MVPLARPCKKKQRQQQQQQQHHHHHLRYARRNSGSSGITTAAAATASAVTATMVTQYLLLGITIIIIIITIVMIMISQHHNHKNNNEDEDDENDGEHSYCSNKTSQAGKEDEQSSCNHVGVKALHNGTVPLPSELTRLTSMGVGDADLMPETVDATVAGDAGTKAFALKAHPSTKVQVLRAWGSG
ncbi:hypothetical protein AK812_SmicGene13717 [Symbiodinium microadriaticum]|uniref:Uncharacterized protein n=1 Tax=Symbiodinium microadriaticum TaxID=2951 RepID=A0A1Q9E7G6_SYMMI|nr:hypothetical protein AK812_SmicGene13717 [Symbiodinium microadriaticum]